MFRGTNSNRGIPRHIMQADFDIVGIDAKAPYADAEIIQLQLTLMDMSPILGEARLQLGHVVLSSKILDLCQVPDDIRSILLEFVKDVSSTSGSQIEIVRQFLSRYSNRLNMALFMSIVSHRGNPNDGILHLKNHFIHHRDVLAALGV